MPKPNIIDLTPSQTLARDMIAAHARVWPSVFMVGCQGTGKRTVIENYITSVQSTSTRVIRRNILHHITAMDLPFTAKGCANILDEWLGELMECPTILYVEDYINLYRTMTCYHTDGCDMVSDVIGHFLSRIPVGSCLLAIAQRGNVMNYIGNVSWMVELTTTKMDLDWIVDHSSNIDSECRTAIKSTYTNVPLSKLVRALNYVSSNTSGSPNSSISDTPRSSDDVVLSKFSEAMTLLEVTALNTEREVSPPDITTDMVGLSSIMNQLDINVLQPFTCGISGLQACRGVLLYGPAGTGKSTIGRWLSHKLGGRFYLFEEESNLSFEESLKIIMKRACDNAPSVIFIDDIDSLVQSSSRVRSLLTALDGIACKGREKICVVATCMDISCVNEALLRGGRLEMCLQFRNPDSTTIAEIISHRMRHSATLLKSSHSNLSDILTNAANDATTIKAMTSRVPGWNCSDIIRCIETTVRSMMWGNDKQEHPTLESLLSHYNEIVSNMADQRRLCSRNHISDGPNVSYYI